jgi:Domain of Unknown Function with PDB structure (DUF3857)/Transglutaminase-like superfamily
MRLRACCFFVLAVFVLRTPALLKAQFQEPTKDELQMTTDPKAPGAAAVYLNIQEVTDDPLHYHSFYARVKVLQEKGKELATVDIPYERGNFKVTDIHGRTIHADGTVIPLEGKPEDLLSAKTADKQFGRKVFTLPSVEVGSILEYSYQIRYDDKHYSSPMWEIQRTYFVHKAHYAFTPFRGFLNGTQNSTSQVLVDARGNAVNSLIWTNILPPDVKVVSDSIGRFTVDIADVPPIPHEEWMPPLSSVLYHVLFYYKGAFDMTDFWIAEAKRWSKDVDHFAEPTKTIQGAVAGIVAPGDSDLDKARKLYKAVQALDNTDFSRQRGQAELKQLGLREAKRAEDTWNQKSGTSQDITLLYLSMLRAAGLTAYDMKVVDRDRGVFFPGYLSFDQLDDDVVILSTGGKEIYLDPGEKMCPFQTLRWTHAGAMGIRQSAEGRGIQTTPASAYAGNGLTRLGDLTLDEHGAVKGDLHLIMTGQEALRWRQESLRNDDDEVKKSFDRWLQSMLPDGVEGHLDHFLGMNDPDSNLMAVCKVGGVLGTATAKRVMLPGFFFQTRQHEPFVAQEKRLTPVDMRYGEKVVDEMVYHFPPSLTVEGAPQDTKIPLKDMAIYATKTVVGPNQVTIADQMLRGFAVVKADEYADLRGFYQKIAAADQQQLVFTNARVALNGN